MIISNLLSSNLWTILINVFARWVVNYGWAIILFTICLKLVLTPLDVVQRVASGRQQRVMNAMQPELAVLQKKYGNDKERLNQETNKLYKKYNTGLGGSCVIMLVSLILNMVIIFTLYSSVRSFGADKLYSSFNELDKTYVEKQAKLGVENSEDFTVEQEEELKLVIKQKYEKLSKSNSWLWVKNVWKSDTKTSQFMSFDDYYKEYKKLNKDEFKDLTDDELAAKKQEMKVRYEFITTEAIKNGADQANGYFVLIILAAVVSFLTQFLSAKLLAPKGQKMNMTNIIMFIVVPVTMLILASTSNVIYTLYIIVNSLITAIISTIISLIMRKINKKYEGKEEEILLKKRNIEVVEYSRNYKK